VNPELDLWSGSGNFLNLEPDLLEPVPQVRFRVQRLLNLN